MNDFFAWKSPFGLLLYMKFSIQSIETGLRFPDFPQWHFSESFPHNKCTCAVHSDFTTQITVHTSNNMHSTHAFFVWETLGKFSLFKIGKSKKTQTSLNRLDGKFHVEANSHALAIFLCSFIQQLRRKIHLYTTHKHLRITLMSRSTS